VQTVSSFDTGSGFTIASTAKRHLNRYVMKRVVPMVLIIIVSWFTFFLKDYRKRVDLAGANLLLFIAFNFTVANDMPRLGDITMLDAFLVGAFVVTALVILVNDVLRRLEINGHRDLAERLDVYAIYGYPLA
jgi:hypothetical protein